MEVSNLVGYISTEMRLTGKQKITSETAWDSADEAPQVSDLYVVKIVLVSGLENGTGCFPLGVAQRLGKSTPTSCL